MRRPIKRALMKPGSIGEEVVSGQTTGMRWQLDEAGEWNLLPNPEP
jgi:hypothetical protein